MKEISHPLILKRMKINNVGEEKEWGGGHNILYFNYNIILIKILYYKTKTIILMKSVKQQFLHRPCNHILSYRPIGSILLNIGPIV